MDFKSFIRRRKAYKRKKVCQKIFFKLLLELLDCMVVMEELHEQTEYFGSTFLVEFVDVATNVPRELLYL